MKCTEGTQTQEGVEVVKEAWKKEQSKGKQAVGRIDQGIQRNEEEISWTS